MKLFTNDAHWDCLNIHLMAFETFMEVFKDTTEGARDYVNRTTEEVTKEHKAITKYILEELRDIRKCDMGAYKAIVFLYRDDIRDVVRVYRESKEV